MRGLTSKQNAVDCIPHKTSMLLRLPTCSQLKNTRTQTKNIFRDFVGILVTPNNRRRDLFDLGFRLRKRGRLVRTARWMSFDATQSSRNAAPLFSSPWTKRMLKLNPALDKPLRRPANKRHLRTVPRSIHAGACSSRLRFFWGKKLNLSGTGEVHSLLFLLRLFVSFVVLAFLYLTVRTSFTLSCRCLWFCFATIPRCADQGARTAILRCPRR